jgi:hypothetical protein
VPKIRCYCDNVINLSPIPAPDGFKLIGEAAMGAIWSQLEDLLASAHPPEETRSIITSLLTSFGNKHLVQVYSCPNCGRLWVFKFAGGDEPPLVYQLEKGSPADLYQVTYPDGYPE